MSALKDRPNDHPCPICGIPQHTRAALTLHYPRCFAATYPEQKDKP